MDLHVDGEMFQITEDMPGHFQYWWVSGPNSGYGFASSSSSTEPRTEEHHVQSIRSFLAAIDPSTGFNE